jgi:asparagine synthase (glutamine-hydrolysing)
MDSPSALPSKLPPSSQSSNHSKPAQCVLYFDFPLRSAFFWSSVPQPWQPLPVDKVQCIWHAGFIANHAELADQMALPEEVEDRELLLSLYQRFGREAAFRILGPFAWIIWDGNQRLLVAARDRTGNYGLYYLLSGGSLILANRIKHILTVVPSAAVYNIRSMVGHLNGRPPVAGETFYDRICALAPAHILTAGPGGLKTNSYWEIKSQSTLKMPSHEYVQAYLEVLQKVVKEYLPTCPVGITLSGGLDSTSIAATIRTVCPETDLTAFSLVSPELPEADESIEISEVCRLLNLRSVTIRADLCWPLSTANGVNTSIESPFRFHYAENLYTMFNTMRQERIRLSFTGDRADLLFGGNISSYPDLLVTGRWFELARGLRGHYAQYEVSLPTLLRRNLISPLIHTYVPTWNARSQAPVPWLGESHKDVYRSGFLKLSRCPRVPPARHQRLKLLKQLALPWITENLNLLAADSAIELRNPFTDHRLIEFAARLPASQVYRAGQNKIIMRKAMRGILPEIILDRLDKIVPLAIFHRGGREREQGKVFTLLKNMRAAELGLVDERCLLESYQRYLADHQNSTMFWYAITLEDWLRRYF